MFKYAPKQSKQHHELLQQFTYRPFLLAEESLAMYFDMPLLNLLLIVNWTATRPSHYRPSFLFRREQKNTKWVSDSKEELHLTNFSVLTKFFADLKKVWNWIFAEISNRFRLFRFLIQKMFLDPKMKATALGWYDVTFLRNIFVPT